MNEFAKVVLARRLLSVISLWFSSVWYPPLPPNHTERNRPSNVEFDGLFSCEAIEAETTDFHAMPNSPISVPDLHDLGIDVPRSRNFRF